MSQSSCCSAICGPSPTTRSSTANAFFSEDPPPTWRVRTMTSVSPLSTSGLYGSCGVKPCTQPLLQWSSLVLSSWTGSWSFDRIGTPPTSLCVPHWSTDLAPISFVTSESDFSKCGHKRRGLSASSMTIVSTFLHLPLSWLTEPRIDHSVPDCDLGMASSLWSSSSVMMMMDCPVF